MSEPNVTAESVDEKYREPFIEVREERAEPAPHTYVRGGFKGTDARFSFYFPAKARYQGRFFHNTYPMATSSDVGPFPIAFDVAMGDLGFTFDSGAYYVQTNLGGADRTPPSDPTIGAYRVNAAAAKYSRVVAAEIYGAHRPYGYLFGGSGGSYQTIGAAENTSGVWDGFLPFVIGTPNAIPGIMTVRMHALRILRKRNKLPGVVDAVAPGGSGDPYADLNQEEAAALREASLLGYPLRGWFNHETMVSGYFSNVAGLMPLLDASYVEDFWKEPGYLGHDDPTLKHERRTFDTEISALSDTFPREVQLAAWPDWYFMDSHLQILSGAAAGKSIPLGDRHGEAIAFSYSGDAGAAAALQVGDKVRVDNSWPLAMQTYQRHQILSPDYYGSNQFRDAKGEPAYPQRGVPVGIMSAFGTAGSVPNGAVHGKVLVLQCLVDVDAFPWQADWYRTKVKEQLGARFDDNFALWFIDHAQHDNPDTALKRAQIVPFSGALQQGLRDLAAWVEKGVKPSETKYEVVDTQVAVPASARERGGPQPVVELSANGGARAEVRIGEAVKFSATIEAPPGAGKIVGAEWDFEGVGDYPIAAKIDAPESVVRVTATHAYAKPGTYFAVLRAASQREGDAKTPYARVQNLARVRVVVS